jgi:hypothetical protein
MSSFYIKKGDRLPALEVQLLGSDRQPLNVSTATVTFRLRAKNGTTLKASGTCSKPNGGADGVVRFSWGVSDTDTAGTFEGEFSCDYSGSPQTVPSNGYVTIIIDETLG